MMSHIIIMFPLHHRPHIIWLVLTVAKITTIRSIMSLSCLHFMIDHICTISHVIILFGFHHKSYPVGSLMKFSFVFGIVQTCMIDALLSYPIFIIDRTYTISHVLVLSNYLDRPHCVWSVMVVQFQFWCRSHLFDQSCHCPLWSLS